MTRWITIILTGFLILIVELFFKKIRVCDYCFVRGKNIKVFTNGYVWAGDIGDEKENGSDEVCDHEGDDYETDDAVDV